MSVCGAVKCSHIVCLNGMLLLPFPLCSEMGAHFSPCGRFLAACVACRSPPDQEDAFTQTLRALNGGALHTFGGHNQRFPTPPPQQPDSPPQPLQANSVVYELRLYSLEESTFGEVLASRTVRAAHCLTSIQVNIRSRTSCFGRLCESDFDRNQVGHSP
jgi:hypothetical protein